MNVKRILLLLLLLICMAVAADESAETTARHNIGAAAGLVTGVGISYRHWFENTFGVQVTGIPWYMKDQNTANHGFSLGLTGLKILKKAQHVNLIGYAGAHFMYNYSDFAAILGPAGERVDGGNIQKETDLNAGGGVGFDFHFWRISIDWLIGLRGMTDFKDQRQIGFTTEGGAYYGF